MPLSRPLRLLRALRGRSARELSERAAQAVHATLERAGLDSDTGIPSLAQALAELRDPAGRPFASIAEAHAALVAPGARVLVPALADRAGTIAAIEAEDPEARARCLALAERLAAGRFDLLGYEGLDWGTPIDWHLDPVANRRAPLTHWSRVPFLDFAAVGDHKVTWEVNRHQWLVTLAQAWWFTGDERWAERAMRHLEHWIEQNPVKRGINWTSMLEVAFRSMSWVWTLQLLHGSAALTPERHVRALGVLARSARHVERYLSTWFGPNTHLTGEALSLFVVGCGVPALRDSARFRALGASILTEWMPRHVRPDGTYVEQSTWYARYTADFLVHAIVAGEASGEAPAGARAALDRAATFLLHVMRPDGSFPLIGDDDGGRLAFLDARPASDLRPTLAAAAALLRRGDLAWAAGPARAEPLGLLGARGRDALRSATPHAPDDRTRAFPDGGFYAMRDGWDDRASLAVIDCGPHAFLNGGHAHADLLGVDLTLRGRAVVRDPGTFTYTGSTEARRAFRSAEAHGALTVDGRGSAVPAGPFTWERAHTRQAARWSATTAADVLLGTHDGFASLPGRVTHARAVVRAGQAYWAILDLVRASGAHTVAAHWPLDAGLTADPATGEVRRGDALVARFHCVSTAGRWRVRGGWQSQAYGHRVASEVLSCESEAEGTQRLATVIAAADAPAVVLREAGRDAVTVSSDEWEDLLVLPEGDGARVGDVEVTARLAWIRRDTASRRLLAAVLFDATHFAVGGQLLLSAPEPVPCASASPGTSLVGGGWTAAAGPAFGSNSMVSS